MTLNTARGATMRLGPGAEPKQRNAHKLLGMRTTDISNNLFQQNNTNNMSSGGKIVRSEFFGFWSQLAAAEQPDAKDFFNVVTNQLKELDKQQQSIQHGQSQLTAAQMNINGISPQSIYNTIAFLMCTTIKFDLDKLQAVYAYYADGSRDSIRAMDSTTHRNIMRLITSRTNGDVTDESVLSMMIIAASSLAPKDIRFHDWLRAPTVDEGDIQSHEFGFVYNYLLTLVQQHGHNVLHPLITCIYDKAHSLPQQAKMSLPVAEQTFFALSHMLRNFLSAQAFPNIDFLEKGIRIFKQFTLWQQPYGKMAEQVVTLLKLEMLNPGYIRRQAVANEALVVDYGTGTTVVPQNANAALNNNVGYQAYRYAKPVFYLYDINDSTALPLLNIIDAAALSPTCIPNSTISLQDSTGGQHPPSPILAQTLVHAFHWISEATQFQPEEVQALCHLQQDKLVQYLQRLKGLEQRYKQESDQLQYNVMTREHDYMQLKLALLQDAQTAKQGPQLFNMPCPDAQLPPPLPPIEHVRVSIELKPKSGESAVNRYSAGGVYDKLKQLFEGYQPQHIPPVSPPPIPALASTASTTSTTSTAMTAAKDKDAPVIRPRELRICIVGGDRFLQQVVTAYYLLQSMHPALLEGLDVKFYMTPCTKNHFANYLARQDLWYHRHIYAPFRCPYPLVVPWLRDDEIEVKQNNEAGTGFSIVSQFYRDSITQYVREAKQTYKATVFKLEGYADTMAGEPTEIVPFLQRIEIGLAPAVEDFRQKAGQPGLKFEDVTKDKTFIFTAPELSIKYYKVDLTGQPKPEIMDDIIPYQSIVLSHVPRKNDQCNAPEPHSTGIELYVQPQSKIEKSRLRKNSLYFDPRQHIADVTCSSPIPFKVLVDGGLYGPFKNIRVSVAILKCDGKIAQFPVQTFFPTQRL